MKVVAKICLPYHCSQCGTNLPRHEEMPCLPPTSPVNCAYHSFYHFILMSDGSFEFDQQQILFSESSFSSSSPSSLSPCLLPQLTILSLEFLVTFCQNNQVISLRIACHFTGEGLTSKLVSAVTRTPRNKLSGYWYIPSH